MTDYRPRELIHQITDALHDLPVVVVTGLRQAGKTTFLRSDPSFSERAYRSLDDYATLEAARRDPDALLQGDVPLTIDEAQRCPELLLAVKRAVDRKRRPGWFLLSGSANFSLLRGIGESLAGRAIYLTLHPFTRREIEGNIDALPFLVQFMKDAVLPRRNKIRIVRDEEILLGGMPSVALGDMRRPDLWFVGYEQTYLERDVRELSQVADLISFRNFLRLAALRTARILNASELARDAKLSSSTATRYLGLLETSFVIHRLSPHLASKTTRLIKTPKLFVSDVGLACHLMGIHEPADLFSDPSRGGLFETYVAQNLAATLGAHEPGVELCFWNVQGRYEVDFIVRSGRKIIAIEVKASARFDDRDLAGLRAFAATTRNLHACILAYNGTEAVSLGDRFFAIPLGLLLA